MGGKKGTTVHEKAQHREAFERYYNMGPQRSLDKLADTLGVNRKTLAIWSGNFHWQQRVRDREKEVCDAISEENKQRILQTRSRLMSSFESMVEQSLVFDKKTGAVKRSRIRAVDVADMEKVTKSYLLLAGESTENVKHDHDLSKLTEGQLRAIIKGS